MTERATLKHYELLSRIGEGGMGVVYRARDTRLGRTVALKTLHAELSQDVERTRRFEREARIISSVSHPGIATLYDFDRDGDVAFLTMEFVEGPTLRECLARGPLPTQQILECAVQVAEALAAAHREGIIHRDLKPENVIASTSGYYKVLDFGVARFDAPDGPRDVSDTQTPTVSWATKAGGIIGTVTYMSPEQALARPLDTRSDIFSFGSLIYELTTGKPAFTGNNEIATAHAIVEGEPEPLQSLRPDATAGLDLVLKKCLAKKPEDRYESAEALARDLRILRQDSQTRSGALQQLEAYRDQRRRLPPWLLIVAAVAVVGVLAVWFAWPTRPDGASEPAVPATPAPRPGMLLSAAGPERPRVIVAFFENNSGDPTVDWLTKGLPEMLTTDLSRSSHLEVIATQRLYDLLASAGQPSSTTLDRSTSAELARWAGATVVISGSVFKAGDRYRIDAQAYDTAQGTVLVARKVEGADLLSMVNELTAGLLEGLQVAPDDSGDLERRATSSTEAFRSYARGKDLHENLEFEEAAAAFRDALRSDEAFALARLRLAISLQAAGADEEAALQIAEVREQAESMPDNERMLALALHAFFHDRDYEAGAAHLERLIEQFPQNAEADVIWARALTELMQEPLRATRKLRRAIAKNPNHLPAIAALSKLLADLGQTEAAIEILQEAGSRNPQAEPALQELIRTYSQS